MDSLLKMLTDGLAAVKPDEMTGSEVPVGKKEEEIYEIKDDELRRFFTFLRKRGADLNKEMDAKTKALPKDHHTDKDNHTAETCPACILGAEKLASIEMHNSLWGLFWARLKESLPPNVQMKMSKAGQTSIRAGWKIVTSSNDESPRHQISIIMLPHDLMASDAKPGMN